MQINNCFQIIINVSIRQTSKVYCLAMVIYPYKCYSLKSDSSIFKRLSQSNFSYSGEFCTVHSNNYHSSNTHDVYMKEPILHLMVFNLFLLRFPSVLCDITRFEIFIQPYMILMNYKCSVTLQFNLLQKYHIEIESQKWAL